MLPSVVSKQIFVLVILRYFVYSQQWDSGLRQRYDGYGEDWIFMPDGNGQPQVAVLKVQEKENERKGVLDEPEIAYIVYTRYPIANPNVYLIYYHNVLPLFTRSSFLYVFKIKSGRRYTGDSK